jgi:hypothetical protein
MINSLYKVISCKWQKPILITAKMKEYLMQEYLELIMEFTWMPESQVWGFVNGESHK